MFKKLQRKFMLVSTLVLLGVILLVEGAVYLISSAVVWNQTKLTLDWILDNGGELPQRVDINSSQATFLALNQEVVYEIRFFSTRTADDTTEVLNIHRMGVSSEEASGLTAQALADGKTYGTIPREGHGPLNYGVRTEEGGSVLTVFTDSSSRSGLIHLVLTYTAAIWLLVLLLYILIMGHYSHKVVKPFAENDEKQKRFITNASHELKTPLAVISANNEMTEALGGKTKWTESTRRQTARLQSLIEDLVVLSRLDEMKDLALAETDITAAVSETAEPFRGVIEGSRRSFTLNLESGVTAHADKRSLQQLTGILLDNAAKYCDEGGQVSVILTRRSRGKGAALTVSNSYAEGKDIDFSRFFERFYRQDESHNSGKSGFGIGLSMAREMAERMKGKLRVSWENGMISFRLEL